MVDILFVEDDLLLRKAFEMRFRKLEFSVISTDNPDLVLKLIEENNPQVIILDIMLPEKIGGKINKDKGLELAIEIGNSFTDSKIILITARGDSVPEEQAQELRNVKGFFTKPIPPGDLLDSINQIINERKNTNEC